WLSDAKHCSYEEYTVKNKELFQRLVLSDSDNYFTNMRPLTYPNVATDIQVDLYVSSIINV
ncbi:hypothetical protein M9458_053554, partial [Cirrhinus mrigala]